MGRTGSCSQCTSRTHNCRCACANEKFTHGSLQSENTGPTLFNGGHPVPVQYHACNNAEAPGGAARPRVAAPAHLTERQRHHAPGSPVSRSPCSFLHALRLFSRLCLSSLSVTPPSDHGTHVPERARVPALHGHLPAAAAVQAPAAAGSHGVLPDEYHAGVRSAAQQRGTADAGDCSQKMRCPRQSTGESGASPRPPFCSRLVSSVSVHPSASAGSTRTSFTGSSRGSLRPPRRPRRRPQRRATPGWCTPWRCRRPTRRLSRELSAGASCCSPRPAPRCARSTTARCLSSLRSSSPPPSQIRAAADTATITRGCIRSAPRVPSRTRLSTSPAPRLNSLGTRRTDTLGASCFGGTHTALKAGGGSAAARNAASHEPCATLSLMLSLLLYF